MIHPGTSNLRGFSKSTQFEQALHSGLVFRGELDLASVEKLEEAISAAEEGTARVIVIDLADLEFMDSAGLTALLRAHTRTRQDGQRLRFVPSSHDAVAQLISVTGTSEMFD